MHYLPKIKALDHRNLNWEKAMRRGTLLTENKKYIVHYCERQPWAANKKNSLGLAARWKQERKKVRNSILASDPNQGKRT